MLRSAAQPNPLVSTLTRFKSTNHFAGATAWLHLPLPPAFAASTSAGVHALVWRVLRHWARCVRRVPWMGFTHQSSRPAAAPPPLFLCLTPLPTSFFLPETQPSDQKQSLEQQTNTLWSCRWPHWKTSTSASAVCGRGKQRHSTASLSSKCWCLQTLLSSQLMASRQWLRGAGTSPGACDHFCF
jgi:hypothetical protein